MGSDPSRTDPAPCSEFLLVRGCLTCEVGIEEDLTRDAVGVCASLAGAPVGVRRVGDLPCLRSVALDAICADAVSLAVGVGEPATALDAMGSNVPHARAGWETHPCCAGDFVTRPPGLSTCMTSRLSAFTSSEARSGRSGCELVAGDYALARGSAA